MFEYIDRAPPALTGDTEKDLQNMQDYLFYLRETLNYVLKNGG